MARISDGVPWTSGTDDNTTELAARNAAAEDEAVFDPDTPGDIADLRAELDGTYLPVAPHLSGRWALNRAAAAAVRALTADTLYLARVEVRPGEALDRIGFEVTTAGTGSTVVRAGIYLPNDNGMPETLLVDGGTVAAIATGNKEVTIDATPTVPFVWVGIVAQTVTGSPATRAFTLGDPHVLPTAFPTSGGAVSVYHLASTSGALPATLTPASLGTTTTPPLVGVRYA